MSREIRHKASTKMCLPGGVIRSNDQYFVAQQMEADNIQSAKCTGFWRCPKVATIGFIA